MIDLGIMWKVNNFDCFLCEWNGSGLLVACVVFFCTLKIGKLDCLCYVTILWNLIGLMNCWGWKRDMRW